MVHFQRNSKRFTFACVQKAVSKIRGICEKMPIKDKPYKLIESYNCVDNLTDVPVSVQTLREDESELT